MMKECDGRFEKLMTSVSHLTDEVMLETFIISLDLIIKIELECWESMTLSAQ